MIIVFMVYKNTPINVFPPEGGGGGGDNLGIRPTKNHLSQEFDRTHTMTQRRDLCVNFKARPGDF